MRRNKPGPKPEYKNAKALQEGVDEYFNMCEKDGVFPDYAGMVVYLGIPRTELDKRAKEDEAYNAVLVEAKERRESHLARTMAGQPKLSQGCMNNLKQAINGGYVDKPVENAVPELKITLAGVGGESAFK